MREARELVAADRSTLFMVDASNQTLWAKVVDGMAPIRLPIGVGVVGSSAELQQVVNITDAYLDSRFSNTYDLLSGYRTKSILCCPVFSTHGDGGSNGSNGSNGNNGNNGNNGGVDTDTKEEEKKEGKKDVDSSCKPELIGVMQLINSMNDDRFNDDDVAMLSEFCEFIGNKIRRIDVSPIASSSPTVNNIDQFQLEINEWKRERKKIHDDRTKYYTYLKALTSEAKELVGCDRGTLFLVDNVCVFSTKKMFHKKFIVWF